MPYRFLCVLSFLFASSVTAAVVNPDLATVDGFKRTCAIATQAASTLKTNAEKQAFVICRDIALAQQIGTFMAQASKKSDESDGGPQSFAKVSALIWGELARIRDELRLTRKVLETIQLKKGEGLPLVPSSWQVDLDGDGQIKTWEQYFFALPRRGMEQFAPGNLSDDAAYYRSQRMLDATLTVDQSDIEWLLSYHYFAEAVIEFYSSYRLKDVNFSEDSIALRDAEGIRRSQQLLVRGLKNSERMRRSILAESDDEHEWIGNARQRNSVFPIVLDDKDFQVWGELLQHLIPLFEGNTLLVFDGKQDELFGQMEKLCPDGQGVNLARFFNKPPALLIPFFTPAGFATMCQPITARHPASGVFSFIKSIPAIAKSSGDDVWPLLLRLMWIN